MLHFDFKEIEELVEPVMTVGRWIITVFGLAKVFKESKKKDDDQAK